MRENAVSITWCNRQTIITLTNSAKNHQKKNNTDYNLLVGKYNIKYYARINVLNHMHINKEFYFRW